jgi:hypothetical protein
MGDFGMGALVRGFIVLVCLLPLGLWKLAELVYWLATHLKVTW